MSDFQVVIDAHTVCEMEMRAAKLVDAPWHLRNSINSDRGWIAVPVEKGYHFESDDASRVARAMRHFGYEHCYAVATEPLGDLPHVYVVPATQGGLLDFSETCFGLNFILIPRDVSFAILCTSEDYNLYAGSRNFVELALGTSAGTARAQFRAVASDECWKGRLLEVADKYDR